MTALAFIYCASLAGLALLYATAPEGWEDSDGFHSLGKQRWVPFWETTP